MRMSSFGFWLPHLGRGEIPDGSPRASAALLCFRSDSSCSRRFAIELSARLLDMFSWDAQFVVNYFIERNAQRRRKSRCRFSVCIAYSTSQKRMSEGARETFEERQWPFSRARNRVHSRKAHALNITTLIPKSSGLKLFPLWMRPGAVLV
jgi:hypothetical protein